MLLSYRFLTDVASVNSFEVVSAAEINAGDTQDLYIQLIDASVDRAEQGYSPAGRRYMPSASASMVVTFTNRDTGPSIAGDFDASPRLNPTVPREIVRSAVQPFPGDASIWKIPLLASDPLRGTVQMKLVLTEISPARTLTVTPAPGLMLRVR
jgi:hypothetical protein